MHAYVGSGSSRGTFTPVPSDFHSGSMQGGPFHAGWAFTLALGIVRNPGTPGVGRLYRRDLRSAALAPRRRAPPHAVHRPGGSSPPERRALRLSARPCSSNCSYLPPRARRFPLRIELLQLWLRQLALHRSSPASGNPPQALRAGSPSAGPCLQNVKPAVQGARPALGVRQVHSPRLDAPPTYQFTSMAQSEAEAPPKRRASLLRTLRGVAKARAWRQGSA
ncbi:hypothetical protein FB451DRAFT_1177960 [Mycena latifolia]|nr:hypothetical protein FB451DRAFT_1177960 [Mycena latifolia]